VKYAIASDMHFGYDGCLLVKEDSNGKPVRGDKYDQFIEAVGKDNDYLILVGDVLDFSVASYEKAYRNASFFFQTIQQEGIIKRTENGFGPVIYLAGNHDADIWYIMQHERSVIKPLTSDPRGFPRDYQHSVAGVLDMRPGTEGFSLWNVTPKSDSPTPFGGMFLDNITVPKTLFYFAYPNLYIVLDSATSILVTHGQYLEMFWSLTGDLAGNVAYDALGFPSADKAHIDLEKMVELNYPLNQLACTGIGQAGVLTNIVRDVQKQVYAKDFGTVDTYIDRCGDWLDKEKCKGLLGKLAYDPLIWIGKNILSHLIKGIEKTRFNADFPKDKEVQQRLRLFYKSSLLEIDRMNEKRPEAARIPPPRRIIFGHTHDPVAWEDMETLTVPYPEPDSTDQLILHNMGGWLMEGNVFHGGAVFKYDGGRFYSTVVPGS
jgi:hypothetical protein